MNALTTIGRAGATEPLHDVHRLGEAGCWSYLHSQRLGRVFIMVGGRPHIFPVNFGVHERTIVFRTAAGAKLDFGPGSMSCFEVDGYDQHLSEGWSVMAFGRLAEITDREDELSRSLRRLPIEPVAPGLRSHWIALHVDEVSGRYFSGGIVPGGYLG